MLWTVKAQTQVCHYLGSLWEHNIVLVTESYYYIQHYFS